MMSHCDYLALPIFSSVSELSMKRVSGIYHTDVVFAIAAGFFLTAVEVVAFFFFTTPLGFAAAARLPFFALVVFAGLIVYVATGKAAFLMPSVLAFRGGKVRPRLVGDDGALGAILRNSNGYLGLV